jgi:hypothetical protein
MKFYKNIAALALGISLVALPGLARGINDGTMPLKLDGTAQQQAPDTGSALTATVHITSAREIPDGAAPRIICEASGNDLRYDTRGVIKVGAKSYTVSGICANNANDNIEIIAQSGGAEARITGLLLQQEQTTQIEGRMKIIESNRAQNRFLIHVSKEN